MNNELVPLPPSVLAAGPSPKVSSRYVHHDSRAVIEIMESEGFRLANVKVPKLRSRDPRFAKHELDFRHPDLGQIDGATPRIIYTGSHDGSSSSKFMMGVYRFICSNGMVVGSTYAKEVVRHSGESAKTLIDRIRALANNTGPLFSQIEQWGKIDLERSAQLEFARLAAVLRFGDAQRFAPETLLEVRRGEDDRGDLWHVFNRVQENAMRGGLVGYSADGRQLTSRPVKSIDQNTSFNVDLWRLAAEFAE